MRQLLLVALASISILLPPTVQAMNLQNIAASAGVASDAGWGVAWRDYDGDGRVDLFVAGIQSRLYRNMGGGVFANVTGSSGISGVVNGGGAAWGDFDNDGDPDLYVGSRVGNNGLFENLGDGTFQNIAAAAGVLDGTGSAGVSWADYDNDGWLDLFVAGRYPQGTSTDTFDRLYHNEGDGTFTDVSAATTVMGPGARRTFMGIWADFDEDLDVDLYLSVDFGNDQLYRNDGGGSFTLISGTAGISGPDHGMGIAIGDPDLDGCLDVVSTNNTQGLGGEHGPTLWYDGNCALDFTLNPGEILDRSVIEWGINWVDVDNDGDEDLSIVAGGLTADGEPNVLYENDGSAHLSDVTASAGVTYGGASLGSAWADIDEDGDLDWYLANERAGSNALFENLGPNGNWLEIKLMGLESNRDGIGTRVELTAGGVTQVRFIQAGESYLSCEEPVAHFGLGTETVVDEVVVKWPSGVVDTLSGLAANQSRLVTEGETVGVVPLAERFEVSVSWRDFQGNQGFGQAARTSEDSAVFYFFDEANWELLFKIVDACTPPFERYWVFYAATTNVQFDITVTDTVTGSTFEYGNPLGQTASTVTDTTSVDLCSDQRQPAIHRQIDVSSPPSGVEVDRIATLPIGSAIRGTDPLYRDRFQASITYEDFFGGSGTAQLTPHFSGDSGIYYFFDPSNWELLLKVLDACGFDGHYWVFYAATTNLGLDIAITDTETDTTVTYANPLGQNVATTLDTVAFATCP